MTDKNVKFTLTAENRTGPTFGRVISDLSELGTKVGSANAYLLKLGAVVASSFAGFAVAEIAVQKFTRAFRGMDALTDLRAVTGSSVENLSALEDVALRTGTSFEGLETTLVRFNKVLTDSKAGSEGAQALEALGLGAKQLRDLDPAEALRRTSVALAGFANDGNKARLVQVLFGKSVKEVAPFLEELATKSKLTGTVSTKAAEDAELFNKQLLALSKNSEDSARKLTADLLPALNRILVKFNDEGFLALFGFDKQFSQTKRLAGLAGEVVSLDRALRDLKTAKDQLGQGGIATPEEAVGNLFGGLNAEEIDKEIARVSAALERAKKVFNAEDYKVLSQKVPESMKDTRDVPLVSLPGFDGDKTKRAAKTFEDYSLEISRGLARMAEESDIARLGTLNAQIARLDELAKAGLDPSIVSGIRTQLLGKPQDFGPPIPQSLLDDQRTLNALLAATPSAALERARHEMELLQEALDMATTPEDEQRLKEAMDQLAQSAGLLPKILESTSHLADDLGDAMAGAFERAIVEGGKLSEILRSLELDILRLITRDLITKPLSDTISGAIKGGDFLSFIGLRANGGPVSAGRPYIVGEKRPELFVPGSDGFIMPTVPKLDLVPSTGRGGDVTVVINQKFDAGTIERRSASQIATETGLAVQRALARNG